MDSANLYQVLGIDPDASSVQIKEAYRYKAVILHPDRLANLSDKFRDKAEGDFKKVNAAYEILSNPKKRQEYDSILEVRVPQEESECATPQPYTSSNVPAYARATYKVYPKYVEMNNALVNVPEHSAFFIKSTGGSDANISLTSSSPWLNVLKTTSLRDNGPESLMKVDIEGVGYRWNKTYTAVVIVKLDEMKTEVKVKLRTLTF